MKVAESRDRAGTEPGFSRCLPIDRAPVNRFADLTGGRRDLHIETKPRKWLGLILERQT